MAAESEIAEVLASAGCVAADEEAAELLAAAGGDEAALDELVARRVTGEPIAWLVGGVHFAGEWIRVDPGVFVPRPQSEQLAVQAAERLPEQGLAVDLCCGSGALAAVLARRRPAARVIGIDLDAASCRCAAANGVEVICGPIESAPQELDGRVDVVVGVVPYVPSEELSFLPRDVLAYEPVVALDGGPGGTRLLSVAVVLAARLLRVGGRLLLEVGGEQDRRLRDELDRAGFGSPALLYDEDGDLRGLEAVRL